MDEKTDRLDLSVIIITKNEQDRLPATLASLPKGCEIILVDSHSTDKTADIARAAGASVFLNTFENYAAQKNHALAKVSRNWVLSVDADETLSDTLRQRIETIAQTTDANRKQAWLIERRLVFLGKNLKWGRCRDYPLRLFPRQGASFVGPVHEKLIFSSPMRVEKLRGGFLQHASYRSWEDYFTKFNNYTSLFAQVQNSRGKSVPPRFILALRPLVVFGYRFFVRLGFLDGYPGYAFALASSFYSFLKYEKLRTLKE